MMIFRASTTLVLEESIGEVTICKDVFFRSESSNAVAQGYAHKLTSDEVREVLDEYVDFAQEVFRTKD